MCFSVQEFGVPFMETSAKSGLNVELAFTAVAKWVTHTQTHTTAQYEEHSEDPCVLRLNYNFTLKEHTEMLSWEFVCSAY